MTVDGQEEFGGEFSMTAMYTSACTPYRYKYRYLELRAVEWATRRRDSGIRIRLEAATAGVGAGAGVRRPAVSLKTEAVRVPVQVNSISIQCLVCKTGGAGR